MDLLLEYEYIEWKGSLRKTYDHYFHPESKLLDYSTKEMWEKASRGEILSLFQFDTIVANDAIRKAQPRSLLDLAVVNSVMRLQSEDGEAPIDVYTRQKNNIEEWYKEMAEWGLSEKEVSIMKKHLYNLNGVADSQESAMLMVMDKQISNFSLGEADKLRKGIAKKEPETIKQLRTLFYTKGEEQGTREQMLDYIWNVQLHRQFGYSFSSLHTYAYSTIAVIEMNIYHHYPSIFWNTACLIVDSSGEEEEEDYEFSYESDLILEHDYYTKYDNEEDLAEVKSSAQAREYGKISVAIANIQNLGVKVETPNLNTSGLSFVPNVENNSIQFGINGISGIGEDIVAEILEKRPFHSFEDFQDKISLSRDKMVSLIKSGAFDEIDPRSRKELMELHISNVADTKKNLTGANIPMLIREDMLPNTFEKEKVLAGFTGYIRQRKFNDGEGNIVLDNVAQKFLAANEGDLRDYGYKGFDIGEDNIVKINRQEWGRIYNNAIQGLKDFLSESDAFLTLVNAQLWQREWNKYCLGEYNKWEMDSVGFYSGKHELSGAWTQQYNVVNFFELSPDPTPIDFWNIKGRQIPKYKLESITGTVLDKNKSNGLVTLSTVFGVVKVKFYRGKFAAYDRIIWKTSQSGKRTRVENSWFNRGNKLLVTGMRRGNTFLPKKYAQSDHEHDVVLITGLTDEKEMIFQEERVSLE